MKTMKRQTSSNDFQKRYFELMGEFDSYLISHLDLLDDLPKEITIAVTIKSNKQFTAQSLALAQGVKTDSPIIQAYKLGRRWVVEPLSPLPA
jgi:hypothetical protein